MDNIYFFIFGFFSAFFVFAFCFLLYQKSILSLLMQKKENVLLQKKISELAAHVVVVCAQLEERDLTKNLEKENTSDESLLDRIGRIYRETSEKS